MFSRGLAKPFGRIDVDIASKTEITERRAPTDASVGLLREMEKAAEDKLVCTLRCTATQFSFTAHVFTDNAGFDNRMRVRFKLGDQPFDFSVNVDRQTAQTKEDYIHHLRKILSDEIAKLILMGSFTQLVQLHHFR